MVKRRRLRKSGGGELEVNMQDVASDEAILPSVVVLGETILLPYVGGGDEGVVESQYFVKQNIDASDAGITQQNVVASDATITQQNVAASDAGIAQQNVVASYATTSEHNVATLDVGGVQRNVAASDEATSEQGVVASDEEIDEEIGEQNGALSQLKHKDSIGIDYFRICGHQIKYRLIKLYKFLEV